MKEELLFAPVKKLFEDLGYHINAEVRHCDVTATRQDELVIIELKTVLNVKLLAQGINRQHMGANVFIAVPKPKNYAPRAYRDIFNVIKKLELGLIFVTVSEKYTFAEIVFEPIPFHATRVYKPRKTALIEEINGRLCDTNTGGITKKKIITAYTEQSIHIACLLEKHGPLSPKQLRLFGTDSKRTQGILSSNYYGWFIRVEKGIYALSQTGLASLSMYPEITEYYRSLIC